MTDNITKTQGFVFKEDREQFFAQTACTIWLTGLSASGKSTLAYAIEKVLFDNKNMCYVLDGDNIRYGLNSNLKFGTEDRSENIRRVAEVAKLMNDAGLIVITSFISPFNKDRELAKEIIGKENFFEVYLSTSIQECEKRDPKGLYQKARNGEITDFTGIQSPYETPISPCLQLDTKLSSVEESVATVLEILKLNGKL